jgi:hypothetical protein
MEVLIVALSSMGTIAFALCAVRIGEKGVRLAIPALLLGLLAAYELYMIRWEHTVVAPIRVDLLLEIPLAFVLLVWGILALILPSRAAKT